MLVCVAFYAEVGPEVALIDLGEVLACENLENLLVYRGTVQQAVNRERRKHGVRFNMR